MCVWWAFVQSPFQTSSCAVCLSCSLCTVCCELTDLLRVSLGFCQLLVVVLRATALVICFLCAARFSVLGRRLLFEHQLPHGLPFQASQSTLLASWSLHRCFSRPWRQSLFRLCFMWLLTLPVLRCVSSVFSVVPPLFRDS